MTIRQSTRNRLDRAPHKLPNGQSQAQGHDAKTGGSIDRADVQANRLAHAHGDHQNAGGGQRDGHGAGMLEGAEHEELSDREGTGC